MAKFIYSLIFIVGIAAYSAEAILPPLPPMSKDANRVWVERINTIGQSQHAQETPSEPQIPKLKTPPGALALPNLPKATENTQTNISPRGKDMTLTTIPEMKYDSDRNTEHYDIGPELNPKPKFSEPEEPREPSPAAKNIMLYRQELEERLKQRYENMSAYHGKIGRVDLIMSRLPRTSLDKSQIEIEFSQRVLNKWGDRIPELEEEYFVITFGDGIPKVKSSKPSIDIGMKHEGGYGENHLESTGRLGRLQREEILPVRAASAVPDERLAYESLRPMPINIADNLDDDVIEVPAVPESKMPSQVTKYRLPPSFPRDLPFLDME